MSASREAELVSELERALSAEHAALSLYRRLARDGRDAALATVLAGFAEEQTSQVVALGRVLQSLGAAPGVGPGARLRAGVLAGLHALVGRRLLLRVCADAERTRAVRYARFAEHFGHTERPEAAATCWACATTSTRHADALEAWIAHGGR